MITVKYYSFSWRRFSSQANKPDELAEETIKHEGNVTINKDYVIKIKRLDNSPLWMILVDEITKTEKWYTDYEGFKLLTQKET